MLTRKSLVTLILAGLAVAPAAAFAWETFIPSNGDSTFLIGGPRYERVDGQWKRVDLAPTKNEKPTKNKKVETSGFTGTSKGDQAPERPVYKNLQEKIDAEMHYGGA